MKTSF